MSDRHYSEAAEGIEQARGCVRGCSALLYGAAGNVADGPERMQQAFDLIEKLDCELQKVGQGLKRRPVGVNEELAARMDQAAERIGGGVNRHDLANEAVRVYLAAGK